MKARCYQSENCAISGAESSAPLGVMLTQQEPITSSNLSVWWRKGRAACLTITLNVLAKLLGQSDDDALRTTQEAEPVDVLVLRHLADEFGSTLLQAGNDVV